MRHPGSFLPAAGAGGVGVHWKGEGRRFPPTDFPARSHVERRCAGSSFLPA
jgi:gluconate 2-dehydrogenase alpha chain